MDIESERLQLVGIWKSAFARPWAAKPRAFVSALIDPEVLAVGMPFRKMHDSFGYMAKGTLAKAGLCSGAIYRSEKFMSVAQADRNGSAGPRRSRLHLQNVHIEHTVPVAVLSERWKAFRAGSEVTTIDAYAWTLVHSVAAAVHMSEKGGLGAYEKSTDAFDLGHFHAGLPFMRYSHHAAPPVIWNVLTGQKIDPATWTFKDHLSSIDALIHEVSADQPEAVAVRRRALDILETMPNGNPPATAQAVAA